jgi:hypothetical protein
MRLKRTYIHNEFQFEIIIDPFQRENVFDSDYHTIRALCSLLLIYPSHREWDSLRIAPHSYKGYGYKTTEYVPVEEIESAISNMEAALRRALDEFEKTKNSLSILNFS